MTTKRTPLHRGHRSRLTPEMRQKAERLLQLDLAHMDAIDGPDRSFYADGRHDELCELVSEVYSALGIKPWDDQMGGSARRC